MLTIELVPKTSWFKNLRSDLPKEQWDKLRKQTYRNAKYHCEVCGGVGEEWPVECHKIWDYDDKNHNQILIGLIALCPSCHKVKHMGRAFAIGQAEESVGHLMEVNSWSEITTFNYLKNVFHKWRTRSCHKWKVDISWALKTN